MELALLTAAQLPHLAPWMDCWRCTRDSCPASFGSGPVKARFSQLRPLPASPRGEFTPTPQPGTPRSAIPTTILEFPKKAEQSINPISNPDNAHALRSGVSDVLKTGPGGLPHTLASLPHMATDLRWESPILRWYFPNNVRNTVQELERERTNADLREAMASLSLGLTSIEIAFEGSSAKRPEVRSAANRPSKPCCRPVEGRSLM